jgi:hypothetical protein
MTVAGAAQNTTRAPLLESFGIEPFFNAFEPERFLAFVFHSNSLRSENTLRVNFIAGKLLLSRKRLTLPGNAIELA